MSAQSENVVTTNDDLKLRFAEVMLPTGVRMHYAEYGDPAGEPIVFLHGFTDSWFSFSSVVDYISAKYHVFLVDQRGHGNSSQPESGYHIVDFADDAIAFFDVMNLEQVTLVGHSLGSLIAQRVAVAAPEKLARLVLMGSTANPYTEELGELKAVVESLQDPVPAEFVYEFQMSTMSDAVPADFVSTVLVESNKVKAHVWRATLNNLIVDEILSPLEKISMPTLIQYGEKDTIWSRSEQDVLAARIPDAQLRVYPLLGHALHWVRPDLIAKDIEAFISRNDVRE